MQANHANCAVLPELSWLHIMVNTERLSCCPVSPSTLDQSRIQPRLILDQVVPHRGEVVSNLDPLGLSSRLKAKCCILVHIFVCKDLLKASLNHA